MPSNPTNSLRLEKQGQGEHLNTWGAGAGLGLNNALDMIDAAIAGYATIQVTGSFTLASANYTTDQARAAVLFLVAGTPAPTAPFTVTTPGVSKVYTIRNGTGQDATFSTGTGTPATVPAGCVGTIICDGSNWSSGGLIAAVDASGRPSAPFNLGGQRLINASSPQAPGDLATRAYVDASAWGTNTGVLPGQTGSDGGILYTVAKTPAWLLPGTSGQALLSNGPGVPPSYVTLTPMPGAATGQSLTASIQLSALPPGYQSYVPTVAGLSVTMPPATSSPLGQLGTFHNSGLLSLSLRDAGGGLIVSIPPDGTVTLFLDANVTAAGVYHWEGNGIPARAVGSIPVTGGGSSIQPVVVAGCLLFSVGATLISLNLTTGALNSAQYGNTILSINPIAGTSQVLVAMGAVVNGNVTAINADGSLSPGTTATGPSVGGNVFAATLCGSTALWVSFTGSGFIGVTATISGQQLIFGQPKTMYSGANGICQNSVRPASLVSWGGQAVLGFIDTDGTTYRTLVGTINPASLVLAPTVISTSTKAALSAASIALVSMGTGCVALSGLDGNGNSIIYYLSGSALLSSCAVSSYAAAATFIIAAPFGQAGAGFLFFAGTASAYAGVVAAGAVISAPVTGPGQAAAWGPNSFTGVACLPAAGLITAQTVTGSGQVSGGPVAAPIGPLPASAAPTVLGCTQAATLLADTSAIWQILSNKGLNLGVVASGFLSSSQGPFTWGFGYGPYLVMGGTAANTVTVIEMGVA
ncbi:MAG: hypothetical protein F8N37_12055 [Telmatospirillum sp.]|nr:hypothetical protein [Telmatospirillum sp.]